jgi:hypothetical protein
METLIPGLPILYTSLRMVAGFNHILQVKVTPLRQIALPAKEETLGFKFWIGFKTHTRSASTFSWHRQRNRGAKNM